jgi:hypothetical protein
MLLVLAFQSASSMASEDADNCGLTEKHFVTPLAADAYAFDETHPIPDLSTLDVEIVREAGNSDVGLVVAGPLGGDDRSISRLEHKIRNYMSHIVLEFYKGEIPTEELRTTVFVQIGRDSSPRAFELLECYQRYLADQHIPMILVE